MEESHRADDDRCDRRPGEWDQVEDRDDQPERDGIRNVGDEKDDRRERPGDQTDQKVARHIAADRPVDVASDRPPAPAGLRLQEHEERLHPSGPRGA